jgi:endonuclease YncB( thermonuclease family)
MWDRRATLYDVHDGDTVTVVLDQGFGDTKRIKVRLLGVYAPELNETGGTDCRNFVKEWFNAQPFRLVVHCDHSAN